MAGDYSYTIKVGNDDVVVKFTVTADGKTSVAYLGADGKTALPEDKKAAAETALITELGKIKTAADLDKVPNQPILKFLQDLAKNSKDNAALDVSLKTLGKPGDALVAVADIKDAKISYKADATTSRVTIDEKTKYVSIDGQPLIRILDPFNRTDLTNPNNLIQYFADKKDRSRATSGHKWTEEQFALEAILAFDPAAKSIILDGKDDGQWDKLKGDYGKEYDKYKSDVKNIGEPPTFGEKYGFVLYLLRNSPSFQSNIAKKLYETSLDIETNGDKGQYTDFWRNFEVYYNALLRKDGDKYVNMSLLPGGKNVLEQIVRDIASRIKKETEPMKDVSYVDRDKTPTLNTPGNNDGNKPPEKPPEDKKEFVKGNPWETVTPGENFRTDADAYGKENKGLTEQERANYKAILDETKGPDGKPLNIVIHIDPATNRPQLIVRSQFGSTESVKVYDLTGERNKEIGLQNIPLSQRTMLSLKTLYDMGSNNQVTLENGKGFVLKLEQHKTFWTNPNIRIWYGADNCGNFRAFFVSDEVEEGDAARLEAAEKQTAERLPGYQYLRGKEKDGNMNSIGDINNLPSRAKADTKVMPYNVIKAETKPTTTVSFNDVAKTAASNVAKNDAKLELDEVGAASTFVAKEEVKIDKKILESAEYIKAVNTELDKLGDAGKDFKAAFAKVVTSGLKDGDLTKDQKAVFDAVNSIEGVKAKIPVGSLLN